MHLLVLLHPCPVCCCCCCCSVLYLLCISLSERQLGRHVEHDLLLSVQGVDRLGTSLTMWHIQTSSKTARERREQSKRANPPGLKILKHRRPFFDRTIDNREWMCNFWWLWGPQGKFLSPLEILQLHRVSQQLQEVLETRRFYIVTEQLFFRHLVNRWEMVFTSHCNLASHYNRTPLALQQWKDFFNRARACAGEATATKTATGKENNSTSDHIIKCQTYQTMPATQLLHIMGLGFIMII